METLVRMSKVDSGHTHNPAGNTMLVPIRDDLEAPGPSQPSHSSIEASDSGVEVDDPGAGFEFAPVPQLVKAVKEALR